MPAVRGGQVGLIVISDPPSHPPHPLKDQLLAPRRQFADENSCLPESRVSPEISSCGRLLFLRAAIASPEVASYLPHVTSLSTDRQTKFQPPFTTGDAGFREILKLVILYTYTSHLGNRLEVLKGIKCTMRGPRGPKKGRLRSYSR